MEGGGAKERKYEKRGRTGELLLFFLKLIHALVSAPTYFGTLID